jgi:hypothetical protein
MTRNNKCEDGDCDLVVVESNEYLIIRECQKCGAEDIEEPC